jgi:hypothetical protein
MSEKINIIDERHGSDNGNRYTKGEWISWQEGIRRSYFTHLEFDYQNRSEPHEVFTHKPLRFSHK